MKPCAIVILNWNGVHFLKSYLKLLIEKTPEHLATIYIVDNDSSDESESFVKTQFPNIHWIQNSKNFGFAGGYNEGLKTIKEPIYCLMNSDIEVSEGWLDIILERFDQDARIASIQPKILDLKDRNKFEYAGGSGGYYDYLGYAICRGRYFDVIETDEGQYDDEVEIFWASGCCIFVRNQVFWEVGGFDADYFAHQEEIDLCWRIHNYGHKIIVMPSSVVYHYGGGALPYGSYFKMFLNFRNSLFNLTKNLNWWQVILILPIRFVLDGLAAAHSIFKTKKTIALKAIFMAHMAYYKAIPKLVKKRKSIIHKGFPKVILTKNILIDYYLFDCKKFNQLIKKK
jgi:hypothetical protein